MSMLQKVLSLIYQGEKHWIKRKKVLNYYKFAVDPVVVFFTFHATPETMMASRDSHKKQ